MLQTYTRAVGFLTILVICGQLPLTAPVAGAEDRGSRPNRDTEQVLHARLRECTVALQSGKHRGSGVVVTHSGYILTAAHVIDTEAQACLVTLCDGSRLPARVIRVNRSVDFAIVKLDEKAGAVPAEIGDGSEVGPGAAVITLCHPANGQPATAAFLRFGRVVARPDSMSRQQNSLVTDLDLQPGDSGGPLFDMRGRLIGMNVMELTSDSRSYGLHRAVRLPATGRARRGSVAALPAALEQTQP